ncbi:MAG: hypothetical protein ACR2K5_07745 [Pseudolabrys sp.]
MIDNLTRLCLALSVIVLITAVLYQFGNRVGDPVDHSESSMVPLRIPDQAQQQ